MPSGSMFASVRPSPWATFNGQPPPGVVTVPVLVSGTRTFTDGDFLREKMDRLTFWFEHCELVVGSTGHMDKSTKEWTGTDYYARVWAGRWWWPQKIFWPDWEMGKKAREAQETEMLAYLLRHREFLCVVFWEKEDDQTRVFIDKARRLLPKGRLKVFKYREG